MKKFKWLAVAGAIALGITGSRVWASDWTVFGANNDGSLYYMDMESLRQVGSWKSIWENVDHRRNPKVKYREEKQLWYYDCQNEASALKAFTEYDAAGSVVRSMTWQNYELHWNPVVPESIAASAYARVCPKG